MLNYDRSTQFQAKNDVPTYVNWLESGTEQYKRGGTAPITESKRRNIVKNDNPLGQPSKDLPIKTIKNPDNVYKSMDVSQNNFHKKDEAAPTFKNSMQKISKIYNSSSGIQPKTKKTSQGDVKMNNNINFSIGNQSHIPSLNSGTNFSVQSAANGSRKASIPNKQIDFSTGSVQLGGGVKRPQTSHKKGSSAYRRERMFNEAGNEFGDFQPNTGNIELESLNNVNNDHSEDDDAAVNTNPVFESLKQFNPLDKVQNQRAKLQNFGNKAGNTRQIKLSTRDMNNIEHVNLGGGLGSGKGFDPKSRNQFKENDHDDDDIDIDELDVHDDIDDDDDDFEVGNFDSGKKNKNKYSKARQVLEKRQYAEDFATGGAAPSGGVGGIQQVNDFSDSDSGNGLDWQPNVNAKKDDKENIVSGCVEDASNKQSESLQLQTEDINDQNPENQKDDQIFKFSTFTRIQRPPTRKVQQAMNLDERFVIKNEQNPDKKPIVMAPLMKNQPVRVRPPSRHKTPSKALGLDIPDNDDEDDVEVLFDNNVNKQKQEKSGVGIFDDDSDSMDFDNMLEVSEPLDQENQQNARPQTRGDLNSSQNQRRKIQTAQPMSRPKETGNSGGGIEDKIPTNFVRPNPADYENKFQPFQKKNENEPKRSLLLSRGGLRKIKDSQIKKEPQQITSPTVKEDPFFKTNDNKKNTSKNQDDDIIEQLNDLENMLDSEPPVQQSNRRKAGGQGNRTAGLGRTEPLNSRAQTANILSNKANNMNNNLGGNDSIFMKNNFFEGFTSSYKDERSNIIFTHNKSGGQKKQITETNSNLPFETTLGKDFVGLFAN